MEPSRRYLHEAVEQLTGPWQLQAQLALAYTLLRSGEEEEALQRLRVVLARSRVERAPGVILLAQGTLGVLHTARDDFEAAEEAHDEAMRIAEEVGYDLVASKVHTQLGGLALYQGRPEGAEHCWNVALQICVRLGNGVGAAMAEVNLAGLRLVARDLDAAEGLLQSAWHAFVEAGVVPGEAYACLGLGCLAALRRQWDEAERWFECCDEDLPPQLAWFVGVERCIARAEREDLEGAGRTCPRS